MGFAPDAVASSAGERADVGDDIEGVRSSTAGESARIVRLSEFEGAQATAGERSVVVGFFISRIQLFNVWGCRHLHVHVRLVLLVLLLLLVFALLPHATLVVVVASCLCTCPTSYRVDDCSQGPTRKKGTKGGVSEVEAGVKFRPAGTVREQVVGHFPGRQQGKGARRSVGGAVTPSAHPEGTRSGYQAIDGLGEGVWRRGVGDLPNG